MARLTEVAHMAVSREVILFYDVVKSASPEPPMRLRVGQRQ